MSLNFWKMHGLGNDFVVIDARKEPFSLTTEQVRQIADRNRGVGFDQMLVIEPPVSEGADISMRVINADGSSDTVCGNGTRCVAMLVMDQEGRDDLIIDTLAGPLRTERDGDRIRVDMGQPRLEAEDIPYTEAVSTLSVDIIPHFVPACLVNMGNPHAVFFVDNADTVPLTELGPKIENDPRFPKKTNVEFCHIIAPDKIRMRVWERGAGVTQACGSGACSVLVAAARRGLSHRKAEIVLDGGSLFIEWADDNHVWMTGPATLSFTGSFIL